MAGNLFDRFTVFFTSDKVFLDGTAFPLGQLTTDVLNLDGKMLTMIDQRVNDFISAVWPLLQEKTDSAASSAQERLNAVWDLIFELPVYRSLQLDIETSLNLFPTLLSDSGKWAETIDVSSDGHRMFEDFLSGLEYFSESLRNFRGQVQGMLELYFEPLSRRCHNCGRYFLLTAGYNTCYCNSIAPGETERTCRKVGAHRKANHPQGLSPAGMEYRKVYNRLKARKQRGKISKDEWNAAVAQAQEVLDKAEQGELSDEEMRNRFDAF